MKILGIFFMLLCSFNYAKAGIFSETGSPKSVHCTFTILRANDPIVNKAYIGNLLENSTTELLRDPAVFECRIDYVSGKPKNCVVEYYNDKIAISYHYNTQNGEIEIKDIGTGQSAVSLWTQQYGVTKSGYLTASLWLRNTKGGLFGDPQVFEIKATCEATQSDWK